MFEELCPNIFDGTASYEIDQKRFVRGYTDSGINVPLFLLQGICFADARFAKQNQTRYMSNFVE